MTRFTLKSKGIHLEIDSHGAWISRVSRPGGDNLLADRTWASPPRPTAHSSYGSSVANFHASYNAGWHLLFPNAGAACEVLGAPIPFHGEVASHDWTVVKSQKDFAEMRTVSRLPLEIVRTARASGDSIRIEDTVRNLAPMTVPYIIGHHPVFPLSNEMRLDLPASIPEVLQLSGSGFRAEEVLSRIGAGEIGLEKTFGLHAEQQIEGLISLKDIEGAWFAARSICGRTSVGVCWDQKSMPHMWVWLQNRGTEFPWFGRAQYLGLEPQSVPTPEGLDAAIKARQHLELLPGESRTCWIEMRLFEDNGQVIGLDPVVGTLG